MTKSEKRYFKMNFSKKNSLPKNYLLLFEAIDKQKEHNESELIEQFKTKNFSKHLHRMKYYLTNLILKNLSSFYSENNSSLRVRDLLNQIEILLQKEQIPLCINLIRRAKSIAQKEELHVQLLSIYEYEKEIDHLLLNKGVPLIYDTFTEEKIILEQLKEIHILQAYALALGKQMLIKGPSRNKSEIHTLIQKVKNEKIFQDINTLKSFKAKSLFNKSHILTGILIGDFEYCYQFSSNQIELIESQLKKLKKNPNKSYISTLNNFVFLCNIMNKETERLSTLKKLKEISDNKMANNIDRTEALLNYYNLKLTFYTRKGLFEKSTNTIPDVIKKIKIHENKLGINRFASFLFLFAYTYFATNQYEKALHYINQILNQPRFSAREDLYSVTLILEILNHYELKNHIIIPNLISSTKRLLKSRKRLYKIETLILDLMARVNNTMEDNIKKEIFEKGKADIINIIENSAYEQKILEYFDFLSWIESKIQKKPFAHTIKEKV